MILVLSCFDLAAVPIFHPLAILSTIFWSMQMYHAETGTTQIYTSSLLASFTMFALLTLNFERHQTAVTKGKLSFLLTLQIITIVAFMLLYTSYPKTNAFTVLFSLQCFSHRYCLYLFS